MDELDNPSLADELPSKSELKRQAQGLQQLAKQMLAAPTSLLAGLDLDPLLRAALEEAPRIRGRGAERRHLRRIAGLLQRADREAIRLLLAQRDRLRQQETEALHRLERWRERLIAGGDEAIGALLAQYPDADRQRLRQLIRAAHKEQREGQSPVANRKLLRYLRGILLGGD